MGLPRSAVSFGRPLVRAPDPGGFSHARRGYRGHAHFWQRALSRRRVIQTAAGVGVLALGGHAFAPRLARAAQMDEATPKPIPGGLDLGDGNIIHVYLPDPGAEPSTITDFRGFVGVSHAQGEGTVTRGGGAGGLSTPTATGDRLLFDADMRFLQGLYVGEDGQEHTGTFAFVWLDLYVGSVDPEFNNQIHDFSPLVAQNGLFWTVAVPDDAVTVNLAAGTAELHVREMALLDSYSVPNNLSGGPSEAATVGFDLFWSDPVAVESIVNTEQGFAGTFLDVTSALAWSGQTAEFAFVSDPAATSTNVFGLIGYEANGVFLPTAGSQATPTS